MSFRSCENEMEVTIRPYITYFYFMCWVVAGQLKKMAAI